MLQLPRCFFHVSSVAVLERRGALPTAHVIDVEINQLAGRFQACDAGFRGGFAAIA